MAMADALSAVKSAVFAVQLGLLEGISSDEGLQFAGSLLIQSEYADVVTERTIIQLCGFPLCRNSLPDNYSRKGRYRISLREHQVFDLQETRLFCCSDCLTASKTFAASLPLERDALADHDRAVELAAAFQKLTFQGATQHIQPEPGGGLPEVGSKTDEVRSHDSPKVESAVPFILIREQSPAFTETFDKPGPSDAIEGYIPQKQHGTGRAKGSSAENDQAIAFEKRKISKRETALGKAREVQHDGKSRVGSNSTASSSSAEGQSNSFTSSVLLDGQLLPIAAQIRTAQAAQPKKKRQNRVSWADQTERKLVEGTAVPSKSDHNRALEVLQESKFSDRSETAQLGLLESPKLAKRSVKASPNHTKSIARDVISKQQPFEAGKGQGFDLKSERLDSAEALATALATAAEAVAQGEADPAEAVASAGISILSSPDDGLLSTPSIQHSRISSDETEAISEKLEGSHISPKDESEVFDSSECWHSAPPKEFKAEVSTFGAMWMALDGWISAASIGHVYGREAGEEDEFTSINGKEYLRQVKMGDGVTLQIERTMASCISRVLPGLVEGLRLHISISTLEQALGQFLRTMSLVESLPPFSSKQWRVVVILLLEALAVNRLPALRNQLLNNRNQIHKVLNSSNLTEEEYTVFRDLILPMGMHPEFASHCGG